MDRSALGEYVTWSSFQHCTVVRMDAVILSGRGRRIRRVDIEPVILLFRSGRCRMQGPYISASASQLRFVPATTYGECEVCLRKCEPASFWPPLTSRNRSGVHTRCPRCNARITTALCVHMRRAHQRFSKVTFGTDGHETRVQRDPRTNRFKCPRCDKAYEDPTSLCVSPAPRSTTFQAPSLIRSLDRSTLVDTAVWVSNRTDREGAGCILTTEFR